MREPGQETSVKLSRFAWLSLPRVSSRSQEIFQEASPWRACGEIRATERMAPSRSGGDTRPPRGRPLGFIYRSPISAAWSSEVRLGSGRALCAWIGAPKSCRMSPKSGCPGVRGTESPPSCSLGFFAGAKLKKVSVSGGAALTLCAAGATPPGASLGSQGMIAFAPLTIGVLHSQ